MARTGKGGRTTIESCTLDKESLVNLIAILQRQVENMTPFENDDDVVTRE